jgi:hypothetical protein
MRQPRIEPDRSTAAAKSIKVNNYKKGCIQLAGNTAVGNAGKCGYWLISIARISQAGRIEYRCNKQYGA